MQAASLKAYWQRVAPLIAGAEDHVTVNDRGATDALPLASDWRHHAGPRAEGTGLGVQRVYCAAKI